MNALRTWRKKRGLTQSEIADTLGVSVVSVSRIERNEQWPDREFFERLAAVTGGSVTANDFLSLGNIQAKPDLNLTGEAA